INEARNVVNAVNNKYGMFFSEVTASVETKEYSGMDAMSDDGWGWSWKYGMITVVKIGLYNMDCDFFYINPTVVATWTVSW
ncbi:MAG: hypothetical protein MJ072_02880, partial [Clostridia bacterium]|nr:hypothetical protein [Clostridia bacterium]